MKRKIAILALSLVVIASLVLGGCAAPAEEEAPEVVIWNIHSDDPESAPFCQTLRWISDEMKEFTDGRFRFDIYYKSALGYETPTIYEPIGQGLIEGGAMWGAHVAGRWPILEAPNVAGTVIPNDIDTLEALSDEVWDEIAKAVQEENLVFLGMANTPGRTIALKDPPEFPLKGIKIRAGVEWEGKIAEYLGGTPVSIAFEEVYMACQRGIVDGIGTDRPSTLGMQFYEVAPHLLDWQLGLNFGYFVVNKDSFEALPTEWQTKLTELGRQFVTKTAAREEEDLKEVTDELLGLGVTFHKVPDDLAAEVMSRIRDEYIPIWVESTPDPEAAELVKTLIEKFGR